MIGAYVEEVMEPLATDNEVDNICDHVDDLLESIYNWDTMNICDLDNMLQEYHHLIDTYDYLDQIYSTIKWNEIPNHHFKYDSKIITNDLVDNELVFGIDSNSNYYLRPDNWSTNFFQF